jgi:DNA replication protein DnaC
VSETQSNHDEALIITELANRQAAARRDPADQLGDLMHRRRLGEISKSMPPLTAEQIARRDAEIAEREAEREQYARADRWRALCRARGDRYADCRLGNFAVTGEHQRKAVVSLGFYCEEIEDRIADGENVILFGPKGTGKDHLAMALCRAAIAAGKHVVWQNGMDLFGDIRDAMDSGDAERALVGRLVAPDVLYLSDPLPPIGNLTEFQSGMLFRILDGRYSRRKPIFCTVNVASGTELDARMGPQNGDRLRDGAMAIPCDWPSYRKAKA